MAGWRPTPRDGDAEIGPCERGCRGMLLHLPLQTWFLITLDAPHHWHHERTCSPILIRAIFHRQHLKQTLGRWSPTLVTLCFTLEYSWPGGNFFWNPTTWCVCMFVFLFLGVFILFVWGFFLSSSNKLARSLKCWQSPKQMTSSFRMHSDLPRRDPTREAQDLSQEDLWHKRPASRPSVVHFWIHRKKHYTAVWRRRNARFPAGDNPRTSLLLVKSLLGSGPGAVWPTLNCK